MAIAQITEGTLCAVCGLPFRKGEMVKQPYEWARGPLRWQHESLAKCVRAARRGGPETLQRYALRIVLDALEPYDEDDRYSAGSKAADLLREAFKDLL